MGLEKGKIRRNKEKNRKYEKKAFGIVERGLKYKKIVDNFKVE